MIALLYGHKTRVWHHIRYKMKRIQIFLLLLLVILGTIVFIRRYNSTDTPDKNHPASNAAPQNNRHTITNPVGYFEIPVVDMERAIRFYSTVFMVTFSRDSIDGNDMALFPINDSLHGISGALAKGESYQPSKNGARIYFDTKDIDQVLQKVKTLGGDILYPKTSIGPTGFVAEFSDSEGNRIALFQRSTD
jgi:uncharacterized protein